VNEKHETLKQLASARKKEFRKLAVQLKKWSERSLDIAVHSLHDKVFSEIDCLECASCCRYLGPRITNQDITRMAKVLRMSSSELFDMYLRTDEDGDMVFKTMPCPFLMSDNYCSIYENRPKACREYPHTDRKRFYQIIDLSLKNIPTCPAVYRIFDELSKMKI
jgi:hypothetical protein